MVRVPMSAPDPNSPDFLNAVMSSLTGLIGGMFSFGWFNGSTKATLTAHDKRISQLENDIRYEIRELRESIDRMSARIH